MEDESSDVSEDEGIEEEEEPLDFLLEALDSVEDGIEEDDEPLDFLIEALNS